MLNLVRRFVPRTFERAISRQMEIGQRARLFGTLAPLVPAVEDMFDGPASLAEFKANGEEFLHIYKNTADSNQTKRCSMSAAESEEKQYR